MPSFVYPTLFILSFNVLGGYLNVFAPSGGSSHGVNLEFRDTAP